MSFSNSREWAATIGSLAALILVSSSAMAQVAPASAWRHVPQARSSDRADGVRPDVRKARDLFFDARIGAGRPLDEPGSEASYVWEQGGRLPELATAIYDAIAVVRFESYRVCLSHSRRSVYTELHLKVERMLKSIANSQSPQYLTVIIPGGKVALANSQIISVGKLDDPYSLQPGHRYVVFLESARVGNFYLLGKTWLLKDGSVWANSLEDATRAAQGSSLWDGSPEPNFIGAIVESVSK